MNAIDNRRHPRVPLATHLRVSIGGAGTKRPSTAVRCRDISRGGIRCSGTLPFLGRGHRAIVTLPDTSRPWSRRLRVPATVHWVDERQTEWVFRFDLTDAPTDRRLARFVSRALREHERLVASHGSESEVAETFRMIESSLGPQPEGSRVVVVTSSVPGEGKSLVASGVAMALARGGKRVLLVDADLYRPSYHESFGLRPAPGVAELLETGTADELDGLIQKSGNLDVIASGVSAAPPSQLYIPDNVNKMIDSLRAMSYRAIVVASPPLLSTASAIQLSKCADDVLLSVRTAMTRERDLSQVQPLLEGAGVSLRGVVLNDYAEVHQRRDSTGRSEPPARGPDPENKKDPEAKIKRRSFRLVLRF